MARRALHAHPSVSVSNRSQPHTRSEGTFGMHGFISLCGMSRRTVFISGPENMLPALKAWHKRTIFKATLSKLSRFSSSSVEHRAVAHHEMEVVQLNLWKQHKTQQASAALQKPSAFYRCKNPLRNHGGRVSGCPTC